MTAVPARLMLRSPACGAALTTRIGAWPAGGRLISSLSTFSARSANEPSPATVYARPCCAVSVVEITALVDGSAPVGRIAMVYSPGWTVWYSDTTPYPTPLIRSWKSGLPNAVRYTSTCGVSGDRCASRRNDCCCSAAAGTAPASATARALTTTATPSRRPLYILICTSSSVRPHLYILIVDQPFDQ